MYRIITPNDDKRSFEHGTDIPHFRLHHGSIRFSLDNPVADIQDIADIMYLDDTLDDTNC